MSDRGERSDLETAIAALESQRTTLGDAATDLAMAALHQGAVADDPPQLKQVTILFGPHTRQQPYGLEPTRSTNCNVPQRVLLDAWATHNRGGSGKPGG